VKICVTVRMESEDLCYCSYRERRFVLLFVYRVKICVNVRIGVKICVTVRIQSEDLCYTSHVTRVTRVHRTFIVRLACNREMTQGVVRSNTGRFLLTRTVRVERLSGNIRAACE
jgi:hypothetical protein